MVRPIEILLGEPACVRTATPAEFTGPPAASVRVVRSFSVLARSS